MWFLDDSVHQFDPAGEVINVRQRALQLPPLLNNAQPTISQLSPIGEIFCYRLVGPPGYSVQSCRSRYWPVALPAGTQSIRKRPQRRFATKYMWWFFLIQAHPLRPVLNDWPIQ
jgi:hypothetical protein